MTGRPANPKPTPAELEARVLDALRAAGDSSRRTDLLNSIKPRMMRAEFDRAIASLAARGEITSEQVDFTWQTHYGKDVSCRAMVYKLAPPGRRKPTTSPPQRYASRRPTRNAAPEGAELEERLLSVLAEADEPQGRDWLRMAVDRRVKRATFETALSALLAAKRIKVETVTRERRGRSGMVEYQVIVCSLPKGRKGPRS